jgi:hypothetical protein
MTISNVYPERFSGWFYDIARKVLKPLLKKPKVALLYSINRNWKDIVGKEFVDFTMVENVVLLKNQKTANLYIISFNSTASFYINNNKSYILDRANNFFGYRAILNLYIKEIPKIIPKISQNYVVDEDKMIKFISKNNIKNAVLREKLNELAAEVYKTNASPLC